MKNTRVHIDFDIPPTYQTGDYDWIEGAFTLDKDKDGKWELLNSCGGLSLEQLKKVVSDIYHFVHSIEG